MLAAFSIVTGTGSVTRNVADQIVSGPNRLLTRESNDTNIF
jgi:hypothetical protein